MAHVAHAVAMDGAVTEGAEACACVAHAMTHAMTHVALVTSGMAPVATTTPAPSRPGASRLLRLHGPGLRPVGVGVGVGVLRVR